MIRTVSFEFPSKLAEKILFFISNIGLRANFTSTGASSFSLNSRGLTAEVEFLEFRFEVEEVRLLLPFPFKVIEVSEVCFPPSLSFYNIDNLLINEYNKPYKSIFTFRFTGFKISICKIPVFSKNEAVKSDALLFLPVRLEAEEI